MKEAGFYVMGVEDCPICPVFFGDSVLTRKVMNEIFDHGDILTMGIPFPVVPKKTARIRCVVSGAHTTEQVEKTIDAFIACGRKLKIIP